MSGRVIEGGIGLESGCSDSESIVEGPIQEESSGFSGGGMISLEEGHDEYVIMKHKLFMNIGSLAQCCRVEGVRRIIHSNPFGKARLGTFQLHSKAMAAKRGGNPNVGYGWYRTSEDEVHRIVNEGFGICGMPEDCGSSAFGLHLSPERAAVDSVLSSTIDECGLRHLVFCRIILGNMEEVLPGSRQSFPTSEKFDSGVVNHQSPKKYIVWYPDVNTRVLPLYVVSIKLDFHPTGMQNESRKRPSSPWIPFNALMSVLSSSLPPSAASLLKRFHNDFMEGKITRRQLILRVRELSGDKLLICAIKSFQGNRKAWKV